jgi:16S rRNA (cytosine1402-N4)-methyltransferase
MEQRGERHVPVLFEVAMEYLAMRRGGTYVDCTLGFAGHAGGMARALGGEGHLVGFDRDPEALELARERLEVLAEELGEAMPKYTLHHAEFSRIEEFVSPGAVDGLLADFGTSSMHLDQAHRGFSFQADGPLDMRMNSEQELTAEQVVNQADENDLANLIYEFGEERRSRRIARAIVRARPLHTTAQLANVVKAEAPPMKGFHPETRTFQALRIYVNGELDEIKALLGSAPALLKPGGRLVVISFHSLEDRLAKDALRAGRDAGIYEVLTPKPVTAGEKEVRGNPRSRSAKLRAAERMPEEEKLKAARKQKRGA